MLDTSKLGTAKPVNGSQHYRDMYQYGVNIRIRDGSMNSDSMSPRKKKDESPSRASEVSPNKFVPTRRYNRNELQPGVQSMMAVRSNIPLQPELIHRDESLNRSNGLYH